MPDIFVSPQKLPREEVLEEIEKETSIPHEITPPLEKEAKKKSKVKLLSSFCSNPRNISFENQDEGEEVLLFLRRHFITNAPWILISIILLFIPLFVPSALKLLNITASSFSNYLIISLIFYYLLVFVYAFVSFLSWSFNISLITTVRIADIDFSDLVSHDVSVTKLNLIEDITYIQIGFVRSLFDYGDVFIQTAGEQPNFEFLSVPSPSKVVDLLENYIGRER